MVRPLFTKAFWTGRYSNSGGYSSGPSKNSGNAEASFEMKTKRSRKNKHKDPFSISAALATVLGHGDSSPGESLNGSREKIVDTRIAQGVIPVPGDHSRSLSSDLESGFSRNGTKLVIHVSKKVSIHNTEAAEGARQHLGRMSDSLQATNDASAWKSAEEGSCDDSDR
jgi:hypothetical protein